MMKKPSFWVGSVCAASIAFAVWSGAQSIPSSSSLALPATPVSLEPAPNVSGATASRPAQPRDRGNYIFRMLQ